MKLTPEQQKELERIFHERRGTALDEVAFEDGFAAGCRYQHQLTVERAARVCDGFFEAADCRDAILALPYETKDE